MTTREIYFKNVVLSELPVGRVGYVFRDKKNVIQLGSDICLKFSTDKDIAEESINYMMNIEKSDGFMFWNASPEGEEFFKSNWSDISKALTNIILKQK